eukprot:gnl/TRDRNA2_/TRDRNA2_162625_c0_seq2.p1 gnl/TRDRNA2_/TRDRNA2_162625_c0~~gnl/TRDRNA2_/TRDRNA2_162625_c0_seq2.p1  ORF type:complete len:521 (+),score=60.02 gnl/TRDRNA2_/TRDRNA2_162625_c0_seq2:133-1563(+)
MYHEELLKFLRLRSKAMISAFGMQDLSNTSWAYAKLDVLDEPLMAAVAVEAVKKLNLGITQNCSNLAWAFATLAVCDGPFFDVLGAEALRRCSEFEPQDITNTTWAFATCEFRPVPLLEAAAVEMMDRMRSSSFTLAKASKSQLLDRAFAFVSIAWVYAFLQLWPSGLREGLRDALDATGREVDSRMICTSGHLAASGVRRAHKDEPLSPHFVVNRPGITVVLKPPGWEVDGPQTEPADQGLLSEWLQAHFPQRFFPLPHLADFQYGFIHRLDIPSSGLILAGTTFQGLYSLRFQINCLTMRREYIVLSHGLMDARHRDCRAKIDMAAKRAKQMQEESLMYSGECSVSDRGKPAVSFLTASAHLSLSGLQSGHRNTSHSLISIRIHTGRNHQIRTHLLYCSLPTVVDGKYTCKEVWLPSIPSAAACRLPLSAAPHTSMRAATASIGLRRMPKSTSGIELRAAPDEEAAGRRVHTWS